MREHQLSLTLPDAAATESLGADLAQSLPDLSVAGVVIHLQGELGAGKTTCVRGFLRRLGVTGIVRSPTYTLLEPYALDELTGVHVDLYRLRSPDELDELGLRDYLAPNHVLLIEWPEQGGERVPAADLVVRLEYDGEIRRARLSTHSQRVEQFLERMTRYTKGS